MRHTLPSLRRASAEYRSMSMKPNSHLVALKAQGKHSIDDPQLQYEDFAPGTAVGTIKLIRPLLEVMGTAPTVPSIPTTETINGSKPKPKLNHSQEVVSLLRQHERGCRTYSQALLNKLASALRPMRSLRISIPATIVAPQWQSFAKS